MTMWNEENKDAEWVPPENGALGPRVGFLDRWATSFDAQNRTAQTHGIENSFRDEEAQQIRALKDAGVENIPSLSPYAHGIFSDFSIGPVYGSKNYLTIADFLSRGGDENVANFVEEYDKRIDELKNKFPALGLRTAQEMYDAVTHKAVKAQSDLDTQRTTFMGDVGGFLGGTIAELNPRTNPFSFMSLLAGGPGKTVAVRVGAQAGIQGATSAVNQLTGVQNERDLLGLESGVGDAASRVAGAAIGGAVAQGIGEGIGAGIRSVGKRWFRNTKIDPAPHIPEDKAQASMEGLKYADLPEWDGQGAWEADVKEYQQRILDDLINGSRDYAEELHPLSPYSTTTMGRARTRMDLDYVTAQLEKWDGEQPLDILPQADTALARVTNDYTEPSIKLDVHNTGKSLDAMAREFDPRAFRIYDELANRVAVYRKLLQDMHPEGVARREELQAQIDDIDLKMQHLTRNASTVGKRRRADMQTKMDALKSQRDSLIESMSTFDTPDMARIRKELVADDIKMREMGPILNRAYAGAQKKWDIGAADREAVWNMIKGAGTTLRKYKTGVDNETFFVPTPETSLAEKIPLLQNAANVEAHMKPGADAADYVTAIVKGNMKQMDKALESYRSNISALIKQNDGSVEINGQDYKLDLDKDVIVVPQESGTGGREITIRQLLEDNAETEADLKAISVCSIL